MKTDKEIKVKAKSIAYREKPSVHAICFKAAFRLCTMSNINLYLCLCQTIIQFSLHCFILWLASIADNYNMPSDWLILGLYSPVMPTVYGPAIKQDKSHMHWNNLLISIERSVVTGKSQTSALPYWPSCRSVNMARSRSESFPWRLHSRLISSS